MSLIEIFKTGSHTDMNGVTRTYTTKDITDIVASYDGAAAPAPLLVQHDETSPTKGIIGRVFKLGDSVVAEPKDVADDFSSLFRQSPPWQLSVSLDPPSDDRGWRLRHVAAVPDGAVPLLPAEFSAGGTGVTIELASPDTIAAFAILARDLREMVTGIRDLFIDKFGLEDVSKVLPSWQLEQLQSIGESLSISSPEPLNESPQFSKRSTKPMPITEEELMQREAAVLEAEATLAANQVKHDREAFVSFCKQQQDTGRVFSSELATVIYMSLPDVGTVEFADSATPGAVKKQTPREAFKTLVGNIAPSVSYEEFAGGDIPGAGGDDPTKIAARAADIQAEARVKGIEMSAAEAVRRASK